MESQKHYAVTVGLVLIDRDRRRRGNVYVVTEVWATHARLVLEGHSAFKSRRIRLDRIYDHNKGFGLVTTQASVTETETREQDSRPEYFED